MFPINPHFIFEASNSRICGKLSENEVKNVKRSTFEIENLLKNNFCDNGINVVGTIEKNCLSHQFTLDEILIEEKLPKKICVCAQSDGKIGPIDPIMSHKFWIKNIRIADDIPGANVLLEMHEDRIVLKTIKTLNTSDELLLWFSEEILSFMGIPFLNPANIQG